MSTEVIPGARTETAKHLDGKAELLRDWISTLLEVPSESVGWGKRSFRLGGSDYYGEGIVGGSDKLWLIRRRADRPLKSETNLWIFLSEKIDALSSVVEFHAYDRAGKLVKEYHGDNNGSSIAVMEGRRMLAQIKKALVSGKSPKRE